MDKLKDLLLKMDCDCSGEGVGDLGGCYRCLALTELSRRSEPSQVGLREALNLAERFVNAIVYGKSYLLAGESVLDLGNKFKAARAALSAPPSPSSAAREDLEYLIEQAAEAEEFCGKICGHRPTDTIREVESEALALGHGLMVALNPFRARLAALKGEKEKGEGG